MHGFMEDAKGIINSFGITDLVDILLVAYLMYHAIRLIRETRAMQLLKGILVLMALYAISYVAHFSTLIYIVRYVFQYGMFALLIVFQPELRHTLEQVGRTRFTFLGLFSSGEDEEEDEQMKGVISAIGEAGEYLSKRRIGALIVLERQTRLGEIIKTGTIIDSAPSSEMIGNIFFPNSPLHDGALVVREGRLYAAGCYLPLSENYTISKELGTRHRAGLGMSENSDAVVVIVSEETGVIAIAENGKLRRGFTSEQLIRELKKYFTPEKSDKTRSKTKGEKKVSLFNKVKR